MLSNFQLATIVKAGSENELLQIPLHQELQSELAKTWQSQYESYISNINEVDFDAAYNLEESERFRISNYIFPDWLKDIDSTSIRDFELISTNESQIETIKCVVAFARNEQKAEVVLFQKFSRSHIIKPGQFLFITNNTYESARRPGLILDDKLSALYLKDQKKLLFHNFRATNTFLPLGNYYKEATEEDVRKVLSHKKIEAEDIEAMATDTNQWFRKRFAMLRDSKILDKYTAEEIKSHSKGYEVNVQVRDKKIIFPRDRAEAKRLLQFLNEELFRGPITNTLFETNSKKESN